MNETDARSLRPLLFGHREDEMAESINPKPKWMRLLHAIEWSRRQLLPFRELRMVALRELAGANYSDKGNPRKVPVNMIDMATTIYQTQLAAKAPQVLVTTDLAHLKSQAWDLELVINQKLQEIQMEELLQEIVLDSLFSMGIAKTGISYDEDSGGESFIGRVDLDDWVHDMSASRFSDIGFMGNRYRIPFEQAMDSGLFKGQARRRLEEQMTWRLYNEEGDERPQSLSQEGDLGDDEYLRQIELWDIWLPHENRLETILDGSTDEPLRTVEWEGPIAGPFTLLYYDQLPNNIVPLPPVANWIDKHTLINTLYRKLGRQAERQKKGLGFQPGAAGDAERIKNFDDGDIFELDNPGSAAEVAFGGIDSQTLAFGIHMKDLFSNMAGNLDLLGGLGPQSDTATQDRILNQNASRRVARMQQKVMNFAKKLIHQLAWYEWTDPVRKRVIVRREPISGIDVPVEWSAETRKGDFLRYNFKIAPYSMQDDSPGSKLASMMQLLQTLILPLAPVLEQQGIKIDFEAILRYYSKYSGLEEIKDILSFSGEEPDEFAPRQSGGEPRQSPTTTRTNVRVNRPGATNQGKDAALVQTLLGAGQPDALASVTRATG